MLQFFHVLGYWLRLTKLCLQKMQILILHRAFVEYLKNFRSCYILMVRFFDGIYNNCKELVDMKPEQM